MINYVDKIKIFFGIFFTVLVFWIVRDIDSLIIYDIRYGLSDLSRYYEEYLDRTFRGWAYVPLHKDPGYWWFTFFLKKIGINFKFFLFCLFFSYYLVFLKVFYKITFSSKWYIYFSLFLILSFWIYPLVTVVLRQGLAFIIVIYLLFRKIDTHFFLKILIILFSSLFHFSAIILLPYVLFEKLLGFRIKLLDTIFIITFVLYVSNITQYFGELFISTTTSFNIGIRALGNEDSSYQTGFSIYKAIAIALPAILFRFTRYSKGFKNILGSRIYIYFSYISIIGMLLSSLPYHDRILLYGWGVTPIMLSCFFIHLIISFRKILKY